MSSSTAKSQASTASGSWTNPSKTPTTPRTLTCLPSVEGKGSIQGFPIEQDDHSYRLMLERAKSATSWSRRTSRSSLLVESARWRATGPVKGIDPGPVERPENSLQWVNQLVVATELNKVRRSVNHGTPLWFICIGFSLAAELGSAASLSPRGRSRKELEI